MNNPINTGIEQVTQVPAPAGKTNFFTKLVGKLPPQIRPVLAKFYSNKMIFWPVTIVFGLLFLVIVLGLLFGSPSTPAPAKPTPSPIPFVQATPIPCTGTDVLCVTGNKLKDLKNQINSLDLKQSHLAPPQINYDINF